MISNDSFAAMALPRTLRRIRAVLPNGHPKDYWWRPLQLQSIQRSMDSIGEGTAQIDAVAAYCSVEEGCTVRLTETTAGTKRPITTHDRPADSPLRIATRSVFVKDEKERPRICFICVGKALCLPPDDPEIENLIHEFHAPGDLTKHFKRKHLANIKEGDRLECKVCQMPLQNKMQVQSHAHRVHGTVS
jgi:hypothetical protein